MFLLKILFLIFIISIPYIRKQMYIKKITKKEVKFDEFDDVEKVIKQEKHEKEQLLTDWEVLNSVSEEAYRRASIIDTRQAYREARIQVEKAQKDIKNFRFLDSVKVEEDTIHESNILTDMKDNGNNFDAELFKKWCKEILKCIKSGTDEELEAVKYFMTEEMYNKLLFQRKKFEKDGLDFVTEEFVITDCSLLEYGNWLEKEEIKVSVKCKAKEYIIQKSTNRIIRGDNKKFYEKEIVMTFLKQNMKDKEGFITNCPNCGAETIQTALGKCRYCDTLVFPIRYNWSLIKFETK